MPSSTPFFISESDNISQDGTPQSSGPEFDNLLKTIFEYYLTLGEEGKDALARRLKPGARFMSSSCGAFGYSYRNPDETYFPNDDLKIIFSGCDELYLVAMEHYATLLGKSFVKDITSLFSRVGVSSVIRKRDKILSWNEAMKIKPYGQWPRSTGERNWSEPVIDGIPEALKKFQNIKDIEEKKSLSLAIWRQLSKLSDSIRGNDSVYYFWKNLSRALQGTYSYYYYTFKTSHFDSSISTLLKQSKWLFDRDGNFLSARQLNTRTLAGDYKSCGDYDALVKFLEIQTPMSPASGEEDEVEEEEKDDNERDNLSETGRRQYDLGKIAREAGMTEDDIRKWKAEKERREALANANIPLLASIPSDTNAEEQLTDRRLMQPTRIQDVANATEGKQQTATEQDSDSARETSHGRESSSDEFDGEPSTASPLGEMLSNKVHVVAHTRSRPIKSSYLGRVADEVQKIRDSLQKPSNEPPPPLPDPHADDDDGVSPRSIDYTRRAQALQRKQAAEIAAQEHGEELQSAVLSTPKYTFAWFKRVLELELLNSGKDSSARKEVSLSFRRIEKEAGTDRTFILKHPSRGIPQWVEDLSGVPLDLTFAKKSLQLLIEVMSVQSYNLRVKLKSGTKLEGTDLSSLIEAKICVQQPTFLIQALKDGVEGLPLNDDDSLKNKLTKDLEFIFGPPGTGKTTFLAGERLIPLMRGSFPIRVLVLAPTNKAADVLTSRIVSKLGRDSSYRNWLIRFGSTSDEALEKLGVCPGKDVNLAAKDRCVVVTTIARFAYDKYIPGNVAPRMLSEEKWDHIIIDEASMIPLHSIIYPLFHCNSTRFTIAGDPFQIEPIVASEICKEENIYTMTMGDAGKISFAKPVTTPHNYHVIKLEKQYRSIPSIGRIFSEYRYGGILAHDRRQTGVPRLEIPGVASFSALNIIKFPVSDYESIFRLKRLGVHGGSSYQIYSAIFTFELVKSIAFKMPDKGTKFRIGVISPYRAQADMVQHLVETLDLPDHIEISAGTVHGFQGDECEMIIALFNPPPGISSGKKSFINKKNIINVAISRARDHLVLLMPDDSTKNLGNMVEVRKVEALMREDKPNLTVNSAADIERQIFGSHRFIYDNSFTTGHQSVNVYGIPEKKYEVRTDEIAVDIQIHERAQVVISDGANPPNVQTSASAITEPPSIVLPQHTGILPGTSPLRPEIPPGVSLFKETDAVKGKFFRCHACSAIVGGKRFLKHMKKYHPEDLPYCSPAQPPPPPPTQRWGNPFVNRSSSTDIWSTSTRLEELRDELYPE